MSAPQQLHHTPRVTQRARARAEGRARLRYGAARYLALLPSSLLLSWLSYNTVAYIGRPAQRARPDRRCRARRRDVRFLLCLDVDARSLSSTSAIRVLNTSYMLQQHM